MVVYSVTFIDSALISPLVALNAVKRVTKIFYHNNKGLLYKLFPNNKKRIPFPTVVTIGQSELLAAGLNY